jgi:hypothetical protein
MVTKEDFMSNNRYIIVNMLRFPSQLNLNISLILPSFNHYVPHLEQPRYELYSEPQFDPTIIKSMLNLNW